MYTISLHNCKFYAHHGLHAEESIVGTTFEVSVSACFETEAIITSIKQTINYVNMYDIVKKHFEQPRPLLESLVQDISADIYAEYPAIQSIEINIKKLNPPITNFEGNVGVSYSKSF